MNYKKLNFAVVGLMLFPNLVISKDLEKKETVAVERNQIVKIDPSSLVRESKFELKDSSEFKIISGFGAKMSEARIYKSTDKKFDVGITKIDKVTLNFHDWPIDEFVYLIEGQVEITDQDLNVNVYGPGDSIVIPKGFSGVWRQISSVTMVTIFYLAESNQHS